ncbi:hypothetical protein BLAT2472_20119 [Burkholderia latens]
MAVENALRAALRVARRAWPTLRGAALHPVAGPRVMSACAHATAARAALAASLAVTVTVRPVTPGHRACYRCGSCGRFALRFGGGTACAACHAGHFYAELHRARSFYSLRSTTSHGQ